MRYSKAYDNAKFLKSPQGRTIRILSEFLEPSQRFRKEGIRNTIVVFGSARLHSKAEARKQLRIVKKKVGTKKRLSPRDKEELQKASIAFTMSQYYEDAVKLTAMLSRWSKTLKAEHQFAICSGGGPGIMEAANKGAKSVRGKSVGLNISLPFEQTSNLFISKNLGFEFHYFFMRKFWFVYLAKAMIMFPGGFGTLDELMEVLTLLQTKKVKKPLPMVLYGSQYWNEIINFESMVKYQTISLHDRHLFRFADTPEEAFNYLKESLITLYHSKK